MIYTIKNVHPSYQIFEENITENDNVVHVKAKCDVDLPRFYFLRKFSPQKKLFHIDIDSTLNRDNKTFSLRIIPLHHSYFKFFGEFSFDDDNNIFEKNFLVDYHYSIRLFSKLLHSKLKKLILEQIQQDFKILYSKMFR